MGKLKLSLSLKQISLATLSLLFVFAIAAPSAFAADSWTHQTGAGTRDWRAIASSDDGTKLVAAAYNDYIYRSIDSGVKWKELANSQVRNWIDITSSSDGTKLVAVTRSLTADGTYLYSSTDSGASWNELTAAGLHVWSTVDVSADGTHMAAAVNYPNASENYIYTSADSGVTWTKQIDAGSYEWQDITMSDDGSTIIAVAMGGSMVAVSTDSGDSWQVKKLNYGTSPGIRAVDSSADGTIVYAATPPSDESGIYKSVNSGLSWIRIYDTGAHFRDISVSADGKTIVAVSGSKYGQVYTSVDSGDSWTATASNSPGYGYWYGVTLSTDGSKATIVERDVSGDGGGVWTRGDAGSSTNPGDTTTAPNEGDGNDDGTKDSEQGNVKTILSPVSDKYVTVVVDPSCALSDVSIVKASSLAAKDSNYNYKSGFVNFTASGCSNNKSNVQIYYHGVSPDGLLARKYNPNTNKYSTISSAKLTKLSSPLSGTLVSYTVTDNGALDTNPADGVIDDPVGLASVATGAPNTGLEQKDMFIFAGALLVGAGLLLSQLPFVRRFAYKLLNKSTKA